MVTRSTQKIKFYIKDFFSKCDQICSFLTFQFTEDILHEKRQFLVQWRGNEWCNMAVDITGVRWLSCECSGRVKIDRSNCVQVFYNINISKNNLSITQTSESCPKPARKTLVVESNVRKIADGNRQLCLKKELMKGAFLEILWNSIAILRKMYEAFFSNIANFLRKIYLNDTANSFLK